MKTLLANCEGQGADAAGGGHRASENRDQQHGDGPEPQSRAKSVLESLRTTKWDLFSAVAMIAGAQKAEADRLLQDVCTWLKTDEHALAGGLASKLTEAEAKAIELLTPTKQPVEPQPRAEVPRAKPGWKQVAAGVETRLSHDEALSTTKKITQQLEENPKLRLTVQWTLEEPQ